MVEFGTIDESRFCRKILLDWWIEQDVVELLKVQFDQLQENRSHSVRTMKKKLVVEKFMKTVEYCPIGENIVDFIEMFQMVNFCLIKLAFLKLLETVQFDPINWNKYVLSNCFKWSFSLGLVNKIFVELLETVDFVRFIAST